MCKYKINDNFIFQLQCVSVSSNLVVIFVKKLVHIFLCYLNYNIKKHCSHFWLTLILNSTELILKKHYNKTILPQAEHAALQWTTESWVSPSLSLFLFPSLSPETASSRKDSWTGVACLGWRPSPVSPETHETLSSLVTWGREIRVIG